MYRGGVIIFLLVLFGELFIYHRTKVRAIEVSEKVSKPVPGFFDYHNNSNYSAFRDCALVAIIGLCIGLAVVIVEMILDIPVYGNNLDNDQFDISKVFSSVGSVLYSGLFLVISYVPLLIGHICSFVCLTTHNEKTKKRMERVLRVLTVIGAVGLFTHLGVRCLYMTSF